MSKYTVYVSDTAQRAIKELPGKIRGRIKKTIDALADDPRPSKSKVMEHDPLRCEPRRLRLEDWRVIYAIVEEENAVDVLAVRKRPPYDYEDLAKLLKAYSQNRE